MVINDLMSFTLTDYHVCHWFLFGNTGRWPSRCGVYHWECDCHGIPTQWFKLWTSRLCRGTAPNWLHPTLQSGKLMIRSTTDLNWLLFTNWVMKESGDMILWEWQLQGCCCPHPLVLLSWYNLSSIWMVPGVKIVVLYVHGCGHDANNKSCKWITSGLPRMNYRIKRILDQQIWDEFQNLKWSSAVQSILRPLVKYCAIFVTRDIIALTWRRLSHFWRPSTWYIFSPHCPCLVAYRYSKIKQSHKSYGQTQFNLWVILPGFVLLSLFYEFTWSTLWDLFNADTAQYRLMLLIFCASFEKTIHYASHSVCLQLCKCNCCLWRLLASICSDIRFCLFEGQVQGVQPLLRKALRHVSLGRKGL